MNNSINARSQQPRLISIAINDLLALELPPRELILEPWLPTQGITMIYAPRGIGKTHVSLGIACAVSAGATLFSWQADKPRGVLFIDGEMPASVIKERLGAISKSMDKKPISRFLNIVTPDLQEHGMPDLSTIEGQLAIEQMITSDTDLIILDNLSTLCPTAKENEAESWQPIQTWALEQRRKGRSVIFIHHSGKNGQQRGTSRREDILDAVITLKRPSDYTPQQGASFEVHFEKSRAIHGDDVAPFIATLMTSEDGKLYWETEYFQDSSYEQVIQMLKDSIKQADIARKLLLSPGTISRHVKRARQDGRI